MGQVEVFEGAKMALFLGDRLVVILRDDTPGLAFADHWDFPGGGREGAESPLDCVLRECREELGLDVPRAAVIWERRFGEGGDVKWFFVARLPAAASGDVVLGDEGQRWALMTPEGFANHPKAIPALQARLQLYLSYKKLEF